MGKFFANKVRILFESLRQAWLLICKFIDELIEEVYYKHRDEDGFLYLIYTTVDRFGWYFKTLISFH